MASLFTKIVRGEIPALKVYEDDEHLAFLDVQPVRPGHVLVIPKQEVAYLFDLPPAAQTRLWEVVARVERGVRKATGAKRVCLAVIGWEVPAAYLGSFALLVGALGGLRLGDGLWRGDVFFHLCSGGLLLGAFFMATDPVRAPPTLPGLLLFGAGAGLLTFLLRFYSFLPEGVAPAIILMNLCVPLIDRVTRPVRFGQGRLRQNRTAR